MHPALCLLLWLCTAVRAACRWEQASHMTKCDGKDKFAHHGGSAAPKRQTCGWEDWQKAYVCHDLAEAAPATPPPPPPRPTHKATPRPSAEPTRRPTAEPTRAPTAPPPPAAPEPKEPTASPTSSFRSHVLGRVDLGSDAAVDRWDHPAEYTGSWYIGFDSLTGDSQGGIGVVASGPWTNTLPQCVHSRCRRPPLSFPFLLCNDGHTYECFSEP